MQFFESHLIDTLVPEGAEGIDTFEASVISVSQTSTSETVVLSVTDTATPEATLQLDSASNLKLHKGDKVEFSGIPRSFTPNPFMMTLEAEKIRISQR